MNIENPKSNLLPPSSDISDNLEILFLDTFSPQSIEDRPIDDVNNKQREFNVGLIQFSNPVVIHELRIIPLSTLVSAESLKSLRLGATIPSTFEVHFYVNDLKAKEAPTFFDLGSFQYREHENNIYKPDLHIPTDGLFLRGQFESLTIAVLGFVTDISSLATKNKIIDGTSKNLIVEKSHTEEIKDLDDDCDSIINEKAIHDAKEIKEPDDILNVINNDNNNENSLNFSNNNNNGENNNEKYNNNNEPTNTKIGVSEDVHSLSPSPEKFTRIRSPSPAQSTTINSVQHHRHRSKEKNQFEKANSSTTSKNTSISRSDSSSPGNHRHVRHLRVNNHHLSSPKSYRSSKYDDDDYDDDDHLSESNRSRHRRDHERDYHRDHKPYDDRTRYHSKSRTKDETDYQSQSGSRKMSFYYTRRSSSRNRRSQSKDSLYGHTQYLRSLERHHGSSSSVVTKSPDRCRSISYERSNDGRRSSSTVNSNSRARYSSSTGRSRRSRSISTERKRKYADSPSQLCSTGESKKSRYTIGDSSSSSSPKKDSSVRSISPLISTSPSSYRSKTQVTNTPQLDVELEDKIHDPNLSPFNMSPHSSISNVSLKSLDQAETELITTLKPVTQEQNGTLEVENESHNSTILNEIELFEPLSPLDDLSDMETDILNSNEPNIDDENYEQISLSSDVEMDNNNEVDKVPDMTVIESDDQDESKSNVINNNNNNRKGELLEIISSDEEYDDELDAALSSENIDYAKNYLDNTSTDKYEDDEVDNAFDINKSLFDPFAINQLKPLSFPFNSNRVTTFRDTKQFQNVVRLLEDRFYRLYMSESIKPLELITENWVQDVEMLATEIMKLSSPIYASIDCDNGASSLNNSNQYNRTISILIEITRDGLDFDLALDQKQTFKVRHLKAGIKMFISLFSSFDLGSGSLLLDSNLPYQLLQLYNKPNMTLPLRLLILNGLMVLCDHPIGVQYVCNHKLDWTDMDTDFNIVEESTTSHNTTKSPTQLTIYQYLLMLILKVQKSRLTSVFEELLDRVHLYELFQELSQTNLDDMRQRCDNGTMNDDDCCHDLGAMLKQVHSSFVQISNRIHRPLRLLPCISQFEIKTAVHTSTPLLMLASSSSNNSSMNLNSELFDFIKTRFSCRHTSCSASKIGFFAHKSFFRFMKHFNILQMMINVLLHDECSNQIGDTIISLLDMITSHQQGLKFLLEDETITSLTNQLHKCLIKNERKQSSWINFGVKFVTRLHTFNLVDDILENVQQNQLKNECFQPIDSLLRLFTMTHLDRSIFRESVLFILTLEHNFDSILLFLLKITTKQFNSTKLSLINEKVSSLDSISFVYATKLAISCIEYLPERNLIHFYESYGQLLLNCIDTVQSMVTNSSAKLHRSDIYQNHILKFASLSNWLAPLKSQSSLNSNLLLLNPHDELTIRTYVTILKKWNDQCCERYQLIDNYVNRVFQFEPEIITAIKILVSICDSHVDYGKNQDPDIQLKYKYSLLHCYSFDCVSYLLKLLDSIVETSVRPSHQTNIFSYTDSYMNLCLKSIYKSNSGTAPTLLQRQHSQQPASSINQLTSSFLQQGSITLEFIRPSIRLLKLILNYLLSSMGNRFNDSTSIPILLRVYHYLDLFCLSVIPSKLRLLPSIEIGPVNVAVQIQHEIVDIIQNIFTSVFVEHSETEEALKRSVWTKAVRHILEFAVSSPRYFNSALNILIQILPQPFPFMFEGTFTEQEMINLINYRKLWSAHLHILRPELEQMLNLLLLCDSIEVQERLRLFCYRLCDLHTPTVTIVCKSLTEFFVDNLNQLIQLEPYDFNLFRRRQLCLHIEKIFSFIWDLFKINIAFRIGILNAFWLFSTSDIGRKDSSKLFSFVEKLFVILNRLKFEQKFANIETSSSLLKDILTTTNIQDNDLLHLITKYFETNRNSIIPPSTQTIKLGVNYKFSEKLSTKFVSICTESLNDYFNKRSPFLTLNTMKNNENNESIQAEITDAVQIYSSKFIELFNKINHLVLDEEQHQQGVTKSNVIDHVELRGNFVDLSRKYLKQSKDGNTLCKILETLYSPVVENPEPPQSETKSSEQVQTLFPLSNKSTSLVSLMNPKRITLRGHGRGGRNLFGARLNDPFRSRPPNTSRPPSMHVDDFVALELRQDPKSGGSRSSGGGHGGLHLISGSSSSSTYGGGGGSKHGDYSLRKKTSHHGTLLHGHHNQSSSSYSKGLLSLTNSSNSSLSHYKSQ
ncbi:hypothetical protein RDWZM_005170 [Blomia tropicalis]|uniref:Virilizer N-terminal domain-containing protein n=1 Tax=Blomia tropicalis TaxID=40697 RepID=A0A9Q0M661_BLOTA|nr:hypothetical protein RDWZM_005170 [Blomia tropicalis]